VIRDRGEQLIKILQQSAGPVTGSELSQRLKVSRQVIVQDVALLRATGVEVLATPQGYMLLKQDKPQAKRAVVAVQHSPDQTETELCIFVDNGIKVIDVIVEHPLYGELRGYLMLQCRADVQHFMGRLKSEGATLLSALTGGVHLHTVEYEDAGNLQKAKDELARKGFMIKD
jgi:transcriptional regulator of NAD metabolism